MLKWWRTRRDAMREKMESERDAVMDEATKNLVRMTNKMLDKPCPFRDMMKCTSACVHFRHGKVLPYEAGLLMEDVEPMAIGPECKLWRR